jgi:hypothetical protein
MTDKLAELMTWAETPKPAEPSPLYNVVTGKLNVEPEKPAEKKPDAPA